MVTSLQLSDAPSIVTSSATLYIAKVGGSLEFNNIRKEKDRQKVAAKVEAMLCIETLIVEGYKMAKAIEMTAMRCRGISGMSKFQLTKDYKVWRCGGQKQNAKGQKQGEYYDARDWHYFLPNYNNGDVDSLIDNQVFLKHINMLQANYCRGDFTGVALHEMLTDQWWADKDIPGIGNRRKHCAKLGRPVPQLRLKPRYPHWSYPGGISPTHLGRMVTRSMAHRNLIRKGEKAAHDHWGAQLLRDRSKLMPLQMVTFDDHPLDIEVIMPMPDGTAQIVRPQLLAMMDVRTGLILDYGVVGDYKRLKDGDGGKAGSKRGLQYADLRFLLNGAINKYGLPTSWKMLVLLENASANLSAEDKMVFERLLPQIEFEQTGVIKNKLLKAGFADSGGMPWEKGWLESYFNLLENRINGQPGALARRYDEGRENHKPQMAYALKVAKQALDKGIPLSEVKIPALTMEQLHETLAHYIISLNNRTRHRLQGEFVKVYEIEMPDGSRVPCNHPMASEFIAEGYQTFWHQESPAECFRRLIRGHKFMVPHPREMIPLAAEKRPITIKRGRVQTQVSAVSSDDLIFWDENNAETLSEWDGKEKALLGFLSPEADQCHLFTNDDDMTYIGSPQRMGGIDISNRIEHMSGIARVDNARQQIRDVAADILEPINQQFAEMRSHNDAVLNREVAPLQSDRTDVSERMQAAEKSRLSRRPKKSAIRARKAANKTQAELARQLINQ